MALFGKKTKKEDTVAATPKEAHVATATSADLSHVLVSPRITEKATMASGMGVYVFDVSPKANKQQVLQAVAQYYKVTPRKVRIVSIPAKNVRNMRTGQRGVSEGGKKAYVYLKKGETITIA